MNENTITINGVDYIRADTIKQGDIKIVVADRGFVYIGRLEEVDGYAILRNASNIRIWGTSKGLGELVNGPTSKTVLDTVGTVRIPGRAVICIIDVDQGKWTTI